MGVSLLEGVGENRMAGSEMEERPDLDDDRQLGPTPGLVARVVVTRRRMTVV